MTRLRWLRRLVGVVGIVLLVWGLLPLTSRVVNVGVIVPAVLGMVGICWGWSPIPKAGIRPVKGWRRSVMIIVIGIVCIFAVLAVVLSSVMLTGASARAEREDATVIVPGAMIVGDEPSRMLRGRLDMAAGYLKNHPQAVCVVSGGQGSDETVSEAAVMERYLIRVGIEPERIYREDRSADTHENMDYSMELIRREGLCDAVVIATQEFHQYRAGALARQAGAAETGALTCRTPLHLLLCYWVRECAAICRLWLIGY